MNRIVLVVIATVLGILIGMGTIPLSPRPNNTPSDARVIDTSAPLPTPTIVRTPNGTYQVSTQKITPSTLSLIANFEAEQTSSELMEQHDCLYGANGGFYTAEGTPLGLFVTEGKTLSRSTISSAANAFLVKKGATLSIAQSPPGETVTFALQTGPYFLPGISARIANDEHARRVIIGKTTTNDWYFLAFTNPDNTFEGPLLSEIPTILAELPQRFEEAINLDGGTASAFYTDDGVRLGELTLIGSLLCGK